jgi:integrase
MALLSVGTGRVASFPSHQGRFRWPESWVSRRRCRGTPFDTRFPRFSRAMVEDVKVVQELLRHSTSRMTLDTYTQALGPDKRAAQSEVVGMIRPKERVLSVYRDQDGVSV